MKPFGTIAEFKNPTELLNAAQSLKEKGFEKFETYSPFPIHGMDKACGLKASNMPWLSLLGGILGLLIGIFLQVWSSTEGYRMIISAKPDGFAALFSFMPVIFELTILIAAFFTIFGIFYLNKLPRYHHPIFECENFKKVTDNGFFLLIFAKDSHYAKEQSEKILNELGGTNVEVLHS